MKRNDIIRYNFTYNIIFLFSAILKGEFVLCTQLFNGCLNMKMFIWLCSSQKFSLSDMITVSDSNYMCMHYLRYVNAAYVGFTRHEIFTQGIC